MQKTIPDAFTRDHWLSRSEFHGLKDAEVLSAIRSKVKQLVEAKGPKPVVLMDLDSTLYEVGPRTHGIILEWLEKTKPTLSLEMIQILEGLHLGHVGYSLVDTLKQVGLDPADPIVAKMAAELKAYWWDRFFSNQYLPLDRPYPGAVKFANDLHAEGAHIVYLTGREKIKMEKGTIENLIRDGFPQGERTTLWMKEEPLSDDLAYKLKVAGRVGDLGQLVASFENEPRNFVGLATLYPEAMHVFMETVCSDQPAPRCQGVYRIRGFVSNLTKS